MLESRIEFIVFEALRAENHLFDFLKKKMLLLLFIAQDGCLGISHSRSHL